MKKIDRKKILLGSLVCLIPMAIGTILLNQMPSQVPIHWNVQGQVDNQVNKYIFVFVFPLVMIAFYTLLMILTWKDPQKKNHNKRMVEAVSWIIPVMTVVVMSITYATSLGYDVDVPLVTMIIVGIIFLLVGNYLPKLGPNYTIGIRTKRTLKSERVWRKTHRMGGPLWFISGILLLLIPFFFHGAMRFILLTILVAISVIVPIIYAYAIDKG